MPPAVGKSRAGRTIRHHVPGGRDDIAAEARRRRTRRASQSRHRSAARQRHPCEVLSLPATGTGWPAGLPGGGGGPTERESGAPSWVRQRLLLHACPGDLRRRAHRLRRVHDRAAGDDPGRGHLPQPRRCVRGPRGDRSHGSRRRLPGVGPRLPGGGHSAADPEGVEWKAGLPHGPGIGGCHQGECGQQPVGLLVVGAAGLVVTVVFAGRDGTLRGQADGDALRSFWWGFGAVLGLWLAVLIARLVSLQWVIDNGHWIAAVLLFVCVLVVAWQNSRRVKEEQSGDVPRKRRSGAVEQSMGAVGNTVGALGRRDWYTWARWTLLVAGVTGVLWGFFHLITLFWFEAAVFVFFMVFWTVQTIELDPSTKPAGGRRTPPPATSTSTRPRAPA